jgi:pimeloyl-ACP methyl ester carboxylesterase
MSLRKAGIYSDRATLTVLPPDVFPLERIAVPALIIHGKLDTLQPFSQGQNAADHIPGARLIALERGGHIPVEQLEEIRSEIGGFVKAHAPAHLER